MAKPVPPGVKILSWILERKAFAYSFLLHFLFLLFLASWTLQSPPETKQTSLNTVIEFPKKVEEESKIEGPGGHQQEYNSRVVWKGSNVISPKPDMPVLMTSQPNDVLNRIRARDNVTKFEYPDLGGNESGVIHDYGKGIGNGTGDSLGHGDNRKIFGMDVRVRKLGVILDVSGSMREILPRVGEEIRRQFPDAVIYFSDGCGFYFTDSDSGGGKEFTRRKYPRFFEGTPEWKISAELAGFEKITESQHFGDMASAIGEMVLKTDVEGIWIFCDFQDEVRSSSIAYLDRSFKKRSVRVYMHSVERPPDDRLVGFCKTTRGGYTINPMKGETMVQKKTEEVEEPTEKNVSP